MSQPPRKRRARRNQLRSRQVETAENEIADKAEELNIEVIMAEEPATLDEETTGALEPVDIQEIDDPGTAKQSVFEVLQE